MYFYLKRGCCSGQNVCFMLINIVCCAMFFAQSPLGLFAQSPQRAFFCSVAALGFLLRYAFCCAMLFAALWFLLRYGFCCAMVFAALWFLLNRRKGLNALLSLKPRGLFISFARTKETKQRKFAVCTFCLLRHFSPLNKKNSLCSNSFLFFTLRKAPPLHGKKVRPDLCAFFMQHRFARWGVMFSLASLVASFLPFLSSCSYLFKIIKRDFR